MVAIRVDATLLFLNVVTAAALLGASMAAFAGRRGHAPERLRDRRDRDASSSPGSAAGSSACRLPPAGPRQDPGWRARMPAWAGPVARGLLLALPVLLVFVVLFSSADAIFASVAGDLFGWQVDLGELPVRVVVAFLVAWAVAGLLGVAAGAAELDWPPRAPPDAVAGCRRGRTAAASPRASG